LFGGIMRQLLVWGSLVGVLTLAAPAGAGERSWYLGLEGGVGADSGWAGLVTLGAGVTSHISLEAEVGYRYTTDEAFWMVEVSQTSLMLNAVYEAPLSKEISVAIGVGVGADDVSVDSGFFEESEVEVAAQLKLGLSMDLGESTELVANYRYMEMITDSGIGNSTLTIGVRFDL
jgi:opacity protein-like surface antigen